MTTVEYILDYSNTRTDVSNKKVTTISGKNNIISIKLHSNGKTYYYFLEFEQMEISNEYQTPLVLDSVSLKKIYDGTYTDDQIKYIYFDNPIVNHNKPMVIELYLVVDSINGACKKYILQMGRKICEYVEDIRRDFKIVNNKLGTLNQKLIELTKEEYVVSKINTGLIVSNVVITLFTVFYCWHASK